MAIIQFPGTDFHDLNLDWVLQQVKNLLTEWANTKQEWETLKGSNEAFVSFITAQWDDFKTYVENYLANLPLTEEVSAKINAMAEDGTLLELITHDDGEGSALSDVAAQWLAAHITQETGYVIDDTLTVQGAAADAKATGDKISDLKSAIKYTSNAVFATEVVNNEISQEYTSESNIYREYIPLDIVSGTQYKIKIDLTSLPSMPSQATAHVNVRTATNKTPTVADEISGALRNVPSGTVLEYDFTATTNAAYLYLYFNVSSGTLTVNTTVYISTASVPPEKIAIPSPAWRVNITGINSYKTTGFYGWESGHTYLFTFDNINGCIATGIIGWLTTSSTWASRSPISWTFDDGSAYAISTPPDNANPNNTPMLVMDNTTDVNTNILVYDITGISIDKTQADILVHFDEGAISTMELAHAVSNGLTNNWTGKTALFIGDSLTEANTYQLTVADKLGISYVNHCKGGYGIIPLIDGQGTLPALSVDDVTGKDLIVLYAGYNNRGSLVGEVGDVYPAKSTIAGYMQYAINKIYDLLASANNLTCKLLIVTVDCAGKYPWIDANGYTEYPANSGQTMETIANTQNAVAEANSIPCVDLWHNSGINRNTWTVFGKQSQSYIDTPTEPSAPYPHNGDQLHKSPAGYKRIGECIVGGIIDAYGN